MLKIASIVFPSGYEICWGHEWQVVQHWVTVDEVTDYRKDRCRHCDLVVNWIPRAY